MQKNALIRLLAYNAIRLRNCLENNCALILTYSGGHLKFTQQSQILPDFGDSPHCTLLVQPGGRITAKIKDLNELFLLFNCCKR